jgi:hypothetical protein
MEGIKVNEDINHILVQAVADFSMGIARGNTEAKHHSKKFMGFINNKIIPVADLGYIYHFYKTQKQDVDQLTDPRLDPLKEEVNYMWNLLSEKYKFEDTCGIISVEARA